MDRTVRKHITYASHYLKHQLSIHMKKRAAWPLFLVALLVPSPEASI